MPIDSIFTPIKKANFSVQPTRVGQRSDWERLTLEIWTDGTIDPQSALQKASETLMDSFYVFSKFDQAAEEQNPAAGLGISPDIYNTLTDLQGNARSLNSGPTWVSNSGSSPFRTLASGEAATYVASYTVTSGDETAKGVMNSAVAKSYWYPPPSYKIGRASCRERV